MATQPKTKIPVVDISSFSPSGSHEQRVKASRDLYNACHRLGFVYITGHGVPDALLEDAFKWTKKLFDLPHDAKMKAPHPATPIPHRGYSAPGVEKVYSKAELDESEASGQKGVLLRKIEDFKVSTTSMLKAENILKNVWLKIFRRAMRSAVQITPCIPTSGSRSPFCRATVLS